MFGFNATLALDDDAAAGLEPVKVLVIDDLVSGSFNFNGRLEGPVPPPAAGPAQSVITEGYINRRRRGMQLTDWHGRTSRCSSETIVPSPADGSCATGHTSGAVHGAQSSGCSRAQNLDGRNFSPLSGLSHKLVAIAE